MVAREKNMLFSMTACQLEQESTDLNCIREHKINQEKCLKDEEGEALERIAWGACQILITGEFQKQIGIVYLDMGHRTDQDSGPIFCVFVYIADYKIFLQPRNMATE